MHINGNAVTTIKSGIFIDNNAIRIPVNPIKIKR